MFKKILSLLLAVLMVFSSFSVGIVRASAADDTMKTLETLIKKFPHGKYWNHKVGSKNNPDGVTDSPCTHHWNCSWTGSCGCNSFNNAIQCMGFAEKVSYDITGVYADDYDESYSLDVTKLRVGDIIRYNGDSHSVCVTGVNGNQVSIVHANYPSSCIIRWETVDKSFFRNITYILHLKGNERTNTDVKWQDAYTGSVTPDAPVEPEEPDVPDTPVEPDTTIIGDGEIWKMGDSNLNIRKDKDAKSKRVGSIPSNAKFDVYGKSFDGEYLWAKVHYDGVEGYSVLNYAEYVSGKHEKPELEFAKKDFTVATGISLSWSAVSGADKYKLSLYDKDKKLIKDYTTTDTSYKLTVTQAGEYNIKITSQSDIVSSWKISGSMKSCSVKAQEVAVTGVTLNKTASVEVGSQISLSFKVLPENATNKALTWASSDTKIATVNSEGKVTGVAPGKVKITCKSKENSKISASCEVTVKPSSVKVVQITKGTSESSVGLSWEKSKGATGYILYLYNTETKKYKRLAKGNGNSYTVKGLSPAKEYVFAVKPYAVVDGAEIYASYRNYNASTTPTAIKGLKQTGSDTGRVRLSWEKKSGADAYVVYKYSFSTKKFEKLATTKTNEYIDKDKSATKVYYRVVSVVKTSDGYARSKSTATLEAITGLDKAKITGTKSTKSAVKLDWSKVSYATHYQIFKEVNGKKVLLKTVTADKLTYTDSSLGSGKTYTYYVRAARKHSSSLILYSSDTTVKVKTS